MNLKDIYYNKYRKELKDGDILMVKGNGLISSIIKWKTNHLIHMPELLPGGIND